MKTIGLIGGISWESSQKYYHIINERVHDRLGGVHSAECLMYSFDFAEVEALQSADDWDGATARMVTVAKTLEQGGADCLVICANTMHLMADAVQEAIKIPLLHIADATATAIQAEGLQKVALLGTRFTMEKDFYKSRLVEKFGLDVLIPDATDRQIIHDIIFEELVIGQLRDKSRDDYIRVIQSMAEQGAEGVILGCTEIGLLIKQKDSPIPVFDTTDLHAQAAVDFALA